MCEKKKVTLADRSGLITAIGLFVTITSSLLVKWSMGDDPWQEKHYIPLYLMICGNGLVFISLFSALVPYCQRYRQHYLTVIILGIGAIVFFIGAVKALF